MKSSKVIGYKILGVVLSIFGGVCLLANIMSLFNFATTGFGGYGTAYLVGRFLGTIICFIVLNYLPFRGAKWAFRKAKRKHIEVHEV